MLPFEAILWDVDGTLADSEPLQAKSFRIAAQGLGITLPDDFHDLILGRSEEMNHALMRDRMGLTLNQQDWCALRYRAYLERLEEVTPIPQAQEIWQAGQAAGLPMALVSNSDRMLLQGNMRAIGLEAPGLISVARNDVVDGKPAPEPYLRAAHLLGVPPGRCAVVEDSTTGARAGLAAGASVFLIGTESLTGTRPAADLLGLLQRTMA